jgi:hypothetical protein
MVTIIFSVVSHLVLTMIGLQIVEIPQLQML